MIGMELDLFLYRQVFGHTEFFGPVEEGPLESFVYPQTWQTFPAGIPAAAFHPSRAVRQNAPAHGVQDKAYQFTFGLFAHARKACSHRYVAALNQYGLSFLYLAGIGLAFMAFDFFFGTLSSAFLLVFLEQFPCFGPHHFQGRSG